MICYRVNNQVFFNAYTAFLYAAHNCPHDHVYFDVHSETFDRVNWMQYPQESYDSLYRRRAQQIRNKYEKIVIAFSGGTDSTAMLRAFLDNNIPVDSIYIGYYHDDFYAGAGFGKPAVIKSWIEERWPEAAKNINIEIVNLSEFISRRYRQSEWILDQTYTFHLRFTPGTVPQEISDIFNEKYGASHWALVTGHEKPEVSADNKTAYYVDKTFGHVMNRTNVEFFYLSTEMPEIVVKHAHDIAKLRASGVSEYYSTKRAIGQLGDIPGVASKLEKHVVKITDVSLSTVNFQHVSDTIELFDRSDSNCMLAMIGTFRDWKEDLVKNWIGGIAGLQTDNTLTNYMLRHRYLSTPTQTIQSYNGLISRQYRIA